MPKIPVGRKGFYVVIDEKVYDNLTELIKRKYERPYGALSSEVQDALVHWISEHQETLELHTNTHKIINPSLPGSHRQARQIIDYLREQGFHLQCRDKDLKRAIENTRGSDSRTIKKWMLFLVDNGYMKWTTHRVLEIV